MAAVHPSRPSPHSRLRSSSDPFIDPSSKQPRPPPPPPKAISSSRMPAPVSKPSRDINNGDITEAVRDTVTVRGNTDYPARTRVARSQTAINPTSNGSVRPSGRRSHSQDSAPIADKSKPSNKSRPKKGSQHADVIDRLDFTGVGPMFHHDGPFDACAPSRNRQRNKAPMFAWSARPDEAPVQYGDSAYPSAHAYKAFSGTNYVDPPKKKVDAIAEAWGIHEPEPYEEFFAGGGSARPDGDTPSSSIYNGRDSHNSHSTSQSAAPPKRTIREGREPRDLYRDYLDESQQGGSSTSRPRIATRRTAVPPPQPIFVGDVADAIEPPTGSPPIGSPGFPKRTKSLMHRIRKMRDAPNVPVGPEHDEPPSSPSSPVDSSYSAGNATRPSHRSQNSFLGRLAGGARINQTTPSSEGSEPFVFIDARTSKNKDLPAPPYVSGNVNTPAVDNTYAAGYFEPGQGGGSTAASPGLGRKASLMKKVGRVVRGGTK